MDKFFRLTKKIIPKSLFEYFQPIYHFEMALLGALFYRLPSRKLKVIGVTGTKGKSSVVEILAAIFKEAGHKTASLSTVRFQIGDVMEPNLYKMTLPGRFFVQKFLRAAVDFGCEYAVLEITSEGARQFRHKFIELDALIFTNLQKEHIESHGSYEKYLEAKLSIAEALDKSKKIPKFMVANAEDKEADKFFDKTKSAQKILYGMKDAGPYRVGEEGVSFVFEDKLIRSPLLGHFNIYNLIAAATCAKALGISVEDISKGIERLKEIPGRAQVIKGVSFDIVVDYAHTPDSLRAIYETFPNRKKICVLGNTGGGRDTWKRPEMGKIADKYCDRIILTNEDPYDEEPIKIIEEMALSIRKEILTIEIDRRRAIALAIEKAKDYPGSIILLTGKGTDPFIMGKNGEKIPWSDFRVSNEELLKQRV